jgi:hypothetical protein
MLIYRVIDVRSGALIVPELTIEAASPEAAAKLALGVDLLQVGRKSDKAARVYCVIKGQPTTMVRLYKKACDR